MSANREQFLKFDTLVGRLAGYAGMIKRSSADFEAGRPPIYDDRLKSLRHDICESFMLAADVDDDNDIDELTEAMRTCRMMFVRNYDASGMAEILTRTLRQVLCDLTFDTQIWNA